MSARLIILGAGIYQVPLINRAQQMGCETYVVSIPGNYPGFDAADHVRNIDTRDAEAILDFARAIKADGIVTTGTDVAMRSLGHVCDALGLCGVSEHASTLLTDKALMKEAFYGKVPTSAFRVVTTIDQAKRACDTLGFPVMVKAVDVSGSRGVTKVAEASELLPAFSEALSSSKTGHFVVERFVDGVEIGVDGFVTDGVIRAIFPHNKTVWKTGGITIPSGHSFPLIADGVTLMAVRNAFEGIVAATGADNCAINADVMVRPDGSVSVLEAGARCGATCIPELINIYSGVDYYEQIIRCALGMACDFTPIRRTPCSASLLFSKQSGVVRSIDYKGIASIAGNMAQVRLDVKEGDRVEAAHNGTHRIGQVIVTGGAPNTAGKIARQVINKIHLKEES